MSNIIRLNAVDSKEKSLSMSNQGTDTFLELIILSAGEHDMTVSQQRLIDYLTERREVNMNAPGTASFDVVEMPWSKETLQEDVRFMMGVIGKAEKPEISGKLDYRPDMRIVTPWLRKFGQMIYGLDPADADLQNHYSCNRPGRKGIVSDPRADYPLYSGLCHLHDL